MTTFASEILDFILGLFDDPSKAEAFAADPEAALAAAGLSGVAPAEVHDVMPMVAGYAPNAWGGRPEHGYGKPDDCDAAPPKPVVKPDDCEVAPVKPVVKPDDCEEEHKPVVKPEDCDEDHKPDHHDHHGHHAPVPAGAETTVIAHVQNIQTTITHVNVEIDASHSIWVGGDAQAIFGNVGKGAVIVDEGTYVGDDNDAVVIGGGIAVDGDVEDVNLAVGNSGPVAQDSVVDSGNTTTTVDLEDIDVDVALGGDVIEDSVIDYGPGSAVAGDQVGSENHGDVAVGHGAQVGDNLSNVGNDYSDNSDHSETTTTVNTNVNSGNTATNSGNTATNYDTDLTYNDVDTTINDQDTTYDNDVVIRDNDVDISDDDFVVRDNTVETEYELELEYAPEYEYDIVEDSVVLEVEAAPAG